MTRYYTAEGYPPGTLPGSGMAALGAAGMTGSEVTEEQLRALFEDARNPFIGQRLRRPPSKYPTRTAVAGFDLTFTVPKLTKLAERGLRETSRDFWVLVPCPGRRAE